jgi:hypothetical protein
MMKVQYIKPKPLYLEDCNLVFWESLPRWLQREIYEDLKTLDPHLDWLVAQDIEIIRQIALSILDKDSVYSQITCSKRRPLRTTERDSDNDELPVKSTKHFLSQKKEHQSVDLESKDNNNDGELNSDLDSDMYSGNSNSEPHLWSGFFQVQV